MEEKAKILGIWGLEQRTKVSVAGNSLIVRIPRKIAKFIGMKKGETVSVHPVGRDKLMIIEEAKKKQPSQA
jgi:antitoxin component of MazEF toxin-antitoxin module